MADKDEEEELEPTSSVTPLQPQSRSSVLRPQDTALGTMARHFQGAKSVGASFRTQKDVRLSNTDRQRHTHVLGATGTGKSKFLEILIRQDLLNRRAGLCLLDPHGALYDDVVQFIATKYPHLADRVILFNPAAEAETVAGFNPIPHDVDHIDYLLENLISACLKAWGQDNTDRTPRITKWLENIFYTIIRNELTLVEAGALISVSDQRPRNRLLAKVDNDLILDDWQMFAASSNTQKQLLLEGAANRLRKFLRNGIIRNIIGQQQATLDFHSAMDDGKIVLINLNGGTRVAQENCQLLGIMLVNEIFRCAKLRDTRDPQLKPFYLYIDEFSQFLTRDIARSLEEARKFKLFLVLAHQHLAQLKREDEYLYASVLTNCQNKVVFGGLSREDAEIMSDELMTGFVDLKKVKQELYTTKESHTLELRTTRSSSQGSSHSESGGNSSGSGSVSSETTSTGLTESVPYRPAFGDAPSPSGANQSGQSKATSENYSQSEHSGWAKQNTETSSESEG